MAAGTGNLEYYLPQEALKYCYLSTLYKEDTEHLCRLFPDSYIFQYDYLNDDIGNVFGDKTGLNFELTWKLPEKLRKDLANPTIKWIILINPPFATSQTAGTNSKSKIGVSDTLVGKQMHKADLGEVSRELFSQFLYRIKFEFANKEAYLGLFATLKYINANNDQKFRDSIFHYTFMSGFIFSSANFYGTSKNNQFPVGFLIWDLSKESILENQQIILDVFNEKIEKIFQKRIITINRNDSLNKWIKRPDAIIKFPPLGSAISVKTTNKDCRDRIAKEFLASLMCAGNTLQWQNLTYFLSGPAASAGALSVTPENFEEAMVVHAARRIPKATWINDRDQFMKPNNKLSTEFISDCTVWNLFCNSNQTAALRNVEYMGEKYQIQNHFFPFPVNEVKQWEITDNNIDFLLTNAQDTFMAKWLEKQFFSSEAEEVLCAGRVIYKGYFANLKELRTPTFKIETYDAGWWQIRQSLKDANLFQTELNKLKVRQDTLKEKILKLLKEYGIING